MLAWGFLRRRRIPKSPVDPQPQVSLEDGKGAERQRASALAGPDPVSRCRTGYKMDCRMGPPTAQSSQAAMRPLIQLPAQPPRHPSTHGHSSSVSPSPHQHLPVPPPRHPSTHTHRSTPSVLQCHPPSPFHKPNLTVLPPTSHSLPSNHPPTCIPILHAHPASHSPTHLSTHHPCTLHLPNTHLTTSYPVATSNPTSNQYLHPTSKRFIDQPLHSTRNPFTHPP